MLHLNREWRSQVVHPEAEIPRRTHQCLRFCPKTGKNLRLTARLRTIEFVPTSPDPDLVDRIATSTGLPTSEAARVVEDVIAFHAETVEVYVRRRHAQLKTFGSKNPEIFARIAEELADRVVAAPLLTERQLRRLVYG